jgi:hypothetical protein
LTTSPHKGSSKACVDAVDGARLTRELGDFDHFRLKTIDLERFLVERPFAIST